MATIDLTLSDDDDNAAAPPAPRAAPKRPHVDLTQDDGDEAAPAAQRPRAAAHEAPVDLTLDSDDDAAARTPPRRTPAAPRPRPLPTPSPRRIRVIYNYGGVQGLIVAPRFLSEAAERRLFESMGAKGKVGGNGRHDLTNAPRLLDVTQPPKPYNQHEYSADVWSVVNAVREHMFPELLLPDFALFWGYQPTKAGRVAFQRHYDSKRAYGETVVGVSLGREALLVMERCPCNAHARSCRCFDKASTARIDRVEVPLPRGSAYVLSGPARDAAPDSERANAWYHAIAWPNPLRPAPSWNPGGERRSITLRATKPWSQYVLGRRVTEALGPTPGDVAARLRDQRRVRADNDASTPAQHAALAGALRAGALPYRSRFAPSDLVYE